MNKKIILKIFFKHSSFIWLIFLFISTIFVTYFYDLNKKNQINNLNKLLNNIYFKNSFKKITSQLKPRYISVEYKVKEGDTYEKIINNLNIPIIDLNLEFQKRFKDPLSLYNRNYAHLNANGYKIVGKLISEGVKKIDE